MKGFCAYCGKKHVVRTRKAKGGAMRYPLRRKIIWTVLRDRGDR